MTRPESIRRWATDDVWDDPGEDWHGQPTKVRPAVGDVDSGYKPDDPPPADATNWTHNNRDAMIQYLDTIQIQNWTDAYQIDNTQFDSPTPFPIAMAWSEALQQTLFIHENFTTSLAKGSISRHGKRWDDDAAFPASTSRLVMVAENGLGDFLAVSDTNTKTVLRTSGGPSWADVVIPAGQATSHNGVIHSAMLDWYIVGSEFNSGGSNWSPRIMLFTTAGVYDSTISPGVPSGYPTATPNGPDIFGQSEERVLLAASNTGGAQPAVWFSVNGVNWTLGRIAGTGTISALAYDPIREMWQAWCGTNLFESNTGAAWVLRSESPGFGCALNQFFIVGSYYVALHISDGTIRYSVDQGATWTTLPFPVENATDDFNPEVYRIFYLRDRWAAISVDSNNGYPFVAFTLRLT